jgi:hypothetical protein
VVSDSEIIKLLRRQHAAVVRLVKRQLKQEREGLNVEQYKEACRDILAALTRYKKGKP